MSTCRNLCLGCMVSCSFYHHKINKLGTFCPRPIFPILSSVRYNAAVGQILCRGDWRIGWPAQLLILLSVLQIISLLVVLQHIYYNSPYQNVVSDYRAFSSKAFKPGECIRRVQTLDNFGDCQLTVLYVKTDCRQNGWIGSTNPTAVRFMQSKCRGAHQSKDVTPNFWSAHAVSVSNDSSFHRQKDCPGRQNWVITEQRFLPL